MFGRNGHQYTDGLGDMHFIVKITQMGTLIKTGKFESDSHLDIQAETQFLILQKVPDR